MHHFLPSRKINAGFKADNERENALNFLPHQQIYEE
jgi:hypothetical protein